MKTLLSAALIAATALCGSVQAAEISIAANSTGKNLDFLRKLFTEFEEKSGHKISLVTMPPSSSEQFAQYRLWLAAGNKDVDVYQTDVVWAPQLADQFIDLKPAAGDAINADVYRRAGALLS
jgi:trehalose/maltose transport system substrate-binding protein